MLANFYQKNIIEKPKLVISILLLILITAFYFSKEFRLDASSETLLLEDDQDLKYLNEINDRYGAKEFLVLTYSPLGKMNSEETIKNLSLLKNDLKNLNWVHNVITLLDIPLLETTNESLVKRIQNFKTLESDDIDKEKGFNEILNSPVFRNFVISEDGTTSGIIVYIKPNKEITKNKSKKEIEILKDKIKKERHQNILEIREVIKKYNQNAQIYLGGIPMIADDMMTFIKNDIVTFGLGVLGFIILTLWYVFRKLIWIIIPISSCFFSVVLMIGFLGFVGWKVTVISSNFIALMLILTMAMNIHMSTRYLQLSKQFPEINKFEILTLTTRKMIWPIFYTVITTICAFMSLIFSEIKPIIDFGWMMTFGLVSSLTITFTLVPSLLNFVKNSNITLAKNKDSKITNYFGNLALNYKNYIFGLTGIIIILSIFGMSKLEVENSFINYFDKKTEIYKGMKLIDEKLGGTTPLEVILKFPKEEEEEKDSENDWGDEEENDEKYWFTKDKIDKIKRVHNYLDSIEAVGKVLSFSSIIEVATKLNNNKSLGSLEMGVLYTKIPDTIKKEIIDPYISVKDSEARISLRIKDSLDGLRRNELINKINFDLENELGLKKDEFKLGGVLILFNNLLQSLFKSQILTLGFVMVGILLMFLILFRNIKISLIGVVPNFIAAFFILGIIGMAKIPLDIFWEGCLNYEA